MSWRDLLTDDPATLPWVGGRSLRSRTQTWAIDGAFPPEHGWYTWRLAGRKASRPVPADPQPDALGFAAKGYLVGNRLVHDNTWVDPNPETICGFSEPVHLLEPGLDRFVRVAAGRVYEDGPLVYQGQEMPLGPEDAVLQAFLDGQATVVAVKGVSPALDAAFRMEVWQREEAEKRRSELERLAREEAERCEREARRRQMAEQLGDGAGRRQMALVDFHEAAKAALAIGGAELLDERRGVRRGEHVVRYRLDGQRFECVCDDRLRIVSSGICLTDSETGISWDTCLTLESLPSVVLQGAREGKLVVLRHA
jgi:hypothetical protein